MDRKGVHVIKEEDTREYKKKIRDHRIGIARRIFIVVVVAALAICGLLLVMAYRSYDDYDVSETVDRTDSDANRYTGFCGNVLKYSNDGASYIYSDDELIWNQTYEMSSPQVVECDGYLSIYDRGGMKIYIFSEDGEQGYIETTMPIEQVCIASQGTVAVLMQKSSSGYLALYDKNGGTLAEGELHGENGGYPIAIALSHDALNLAVSMLDFSDGGIKSTVAFYNYGNAGQNEIDRCVGMLSFDDTVIPEMAYTKNDRVIGFSESGIYIFEGGGKPELASQVESEKDILGIFYNDEYFGVTTDNDAETVGRHLAVYDKTGKMVMEQDIDGTIGDIGLTSGNEVYIFDGNICDIYTLRGVHKFHYEFDEKIYCLIPGVLGLNYTVVREGVTENIRLK